MLQNEIVGKLQLKDKSLYKCTEETPGWYCQAKLGSLRLETRKGEPEPYAKPQNHNRREH